MTDTARDAIAAAFDAIETVDMTEEVVDEPQETPEPPAVESETEEPAQGSEQGDGEHPPEGESSEASGTGDGSVEPPEPPASTFVKAPPGWENDWEKLDPDVQMRIKDREREIHQQIGATTEARRLNERYNEVIGPYLGEMQQMGVDPLQAVGDLLGMGKVLRTGGQGEKANLIAQLVRNNNVDIQELDNALAGMVSGSGGPDIQQQISQAVQQQLTPVRQYMQSQQAQQQAAAQQGVFDEIDAFAADPKHPYFEDVQDVMADLISSDGSLTLEDAYERAIWADPQIRAHMLSQQPAATGQVGNVADKAAAASSIRSSSTPPAATIKEDHPDIASAVAAAYDAQASGGRSRL